MKLINMAEEEVRCWVCRRTAEEVKHDLTEMGGKESAEKLFAIIKKESKESKDNALTEDGLIASADIVYGYSLPLCAICKGMLDLLAYMNAREVIDDRSEKMLIDIRDRARIIFKGITPDL